MTSMTVRRKKRKDEIKVTVGPFRHQTDYKSCEEIQREALGSQDIDVIPIPMLLDAKYVGGILLGAYSGLGELVGFTFSIPGSLNGQSLQNCSMLAVRSAYRNFDVGFKLQMALFKEAAKNKINYITCAFDPMQPALSYFFLGKLAFRSNAYEENLYGETTSHFDRGLPTDRMLAVWDLQSPAVARRLESGPPRHDYRKEIRRGALINQVVETAPGLFTSAAVQTDCTTESFIFEVPYNLPEIKNRDLGVATAWQHSLRQVFSVYFKKGYAAVDFWVAEQDGHLHACYQLEKQKQ